MGPGALEGGAAAAGAVASAATVSGGAAEGIGGAASAVSNIDAGLASMGSGFETAAQAGKLSEGLTVPDVDANLAGQLENVSVENAGPALTDLAKGGDSNIPSGGEPTAVGAPGEPEGPGTSGSILSRRDGPTWVDKSAGRVPVPNGVRLDASSSGDTAIPAGGQPPEGPAEAVVTGEPPAPGESTSDGATPQTTGAESATSAAAAEEPPATGDSGTPAAETTGSQTPPVEPHVMEFGDEQKRELTELRGKSDLTPEEQVKKSQLEQAETADMNARTKAYEETSAANVAQDSGAETPPAGADATTETTTETAPPEPATSEAAQPDEARKQRSTELQGKIDNGTITRDEYLEYKKLQQDPEKRQAELKEKAKQGTLTAEEENEYFEGSTDASDITPEDESIQDAEGQSPEQIAQGFTDLQEEAFRKMEDGDLKGMEEAMLAYNEKLAQMQGYSMTEADKAKASELIRGMFKSEGVNAPESNRYRHIRNKLQELGQLEMQVHQLAQAVRKMQDNERKMKDQVNSAENNYVSTSNPAEKAKKYQLFAVASLRLAQYQENIKQQKGKGHDLSLKRRQVRGYVHRKLGTKNAVYNVMFGAGTAMMQGSYAVAGAAGSIDEAIFDR